MFLRWRSIKIFYGWWIVGASLLTTLYMGGVVFYGFTAFFEPIVNEMGWSYTQVSLAASLRGLEMGLLAPFIGILVDRWGPRRLIVIGVIIAAAGLVVLSATTSLGMFYGAFALLAIGMSATSTTVLMTTIANWFHRKMGMASGIAICGFGLSGLLIPVIVRLIAVYGWRVTLDILAAGMVVMILPLSLFFRHKPEAYGYSPDGEPENSSSYSNSLDVPHDEIEVKARQAIKSATFWRFALAFMYHMMVTSTVVTHVMPYLGSISVSRTMSGLVATSIPLTSILGRLGFGWLGDRFDKRKVATVGFVMMGCGLFFFGYASAMNKWMLVLFLALFGVGYGGNNALRPSLTREYFGRRNFGSIFGLILGIGAIGGITGPTLAGWVYDNWGSYQAVWFLLAGLAIVAIISILTMAPGRSAVALGDRTGHCVDTNRGSD